MANILFVYERKMPTTEGIHEIFNSEEAKEYGIFARFVTVWRVNRELLCWADGIVFVRTLDLLSQWILRKNNKSQICYHQYSSRRKSLHSYI